MSSDLVLACGVKQYSIRRRKGAPLNEKVRK